MGLPQRSAACVCGHGLKLSCPVFLLLTIPFPISAEFVTVWSCVSITFFEVSNSYKSANLVPTIVYWTRESNMWITLMSGYWNALRYSFGFRGRLARKGYWAFMATHLVVLFVLMYGHVFDERALLYYVLLTCPALLSSSCRRLHDAGYPAWVLVLGVVPILGNVFLVYCLLKLGQPYHNRFGPNPRVWKLH